MSINLHLEDGKGNEFSLKQTPTFITRMCLTPANSKREDVLARYKIWVQSTLNGVWKDSTDLKYATLDVKEHLSELDKWCNKHKDYRFYSM